MKFPDNIEKWRNLVENTFGGLISQNESYKSLINRFKLTISDWVDIILSLIQKESGGNEYATGDKGNSIGLMQLNYGAGTQQFLGFKGQKNELYNPDKNIYYGIKYFLYQLDRYKDVNQAVAAYNAGSVKYTQAGTLINLEYVNDVLNFLAEKKTLLQPYSQQQEYTLFIKQVKDDIAAIINELQFILKKLNQIT
jgi:hypothetical protein